jgi:hypothetical protein
MRILIQTSIFFYLLASPVASDWGWYRGDIATFPASNTSSGISESIHQAVNAGLDWVVLSTPPGTGTFIGQNEIVEEIKLTLPRLTPILATGWQDNETSARVLGVDARAPIPNKLDDLLATVAAHKGLSIVSAATVASSPIPGIRTFSPIRNGKWTPSINIGDAWDQALTEGRRIFIAGTSLDEAPASTHYTTVWAEGNHADQIIEALRDGSSFVSDRDGIHLDFQVDGHTFGQTVFHQGEPFIRIRAHGHHPISSVTLVADGVEIWTAHPNEAVWEERFFLPAADYGYVRAVLRSEIGGHQALGNPVFLVAEDAPDGELPLIEGTRSALTDDLVEMGGIVEALAGLRGDVQARILREFLATPTTRYGTSWLLQNRSDIVGDQTLADLATTDPEIEARLGAAYALITRGSDLAPEVLLEFLGTSSSTDLQRYAARMFTHYTEGFSESDWPWEPSRDPETAAYLIRAYRPSRYNQDDVGRILDVLDSDHRALLDAASDKLVELGSRHYRVIEVLLDATRSGQSRAADILGIISDHRTVSALQRIFAQAQDAELRRSVFLALSKMGAPYPDRLIVTLPDLNQAPVIDGIAEADEWQGATVLADLRSDWDGRPSEASPKIRAGRASDSLYISMTQDIATTPIATLTNISDGSIKDDLIEISFADLTSRDGALPHSRVSVNAMGAVSQTGQIPIRAVSRVTEALWEVELSVPRSAVDALPRFNICFISGNDPQKRLAWSVTYGAPDDPSRFGELSSELTP